MQQSEKPDLETGFLFIDLDAVGLEVVASDLSWRNALVLTDQDVNPISRGEKKKKGRHALERISRSLPFAAYLDADTNTFINVFCSTLIVDAELESVTVSELERARVLVGRGKADMVEKRARAALGIPDKEFSAWFGPNLGVSARDDL
jgi:hypothetical protein